MFHAPIWLESAVRFTAVCFANNKGTPRAKRALRAETAEIALLIACSVNPAVSPKVFRFVTVFAGLFCCVRLRLGAPLDWLNRNLRLFNTFTFGTPHAL